MELYTLDKKRTLVRSEMENDHNRIWMNMCPNNRFE
jgi:uncharacterized Zn-finger protein